MTDLELIQDKLLTSFDIPTKIHSECVCVEGSNDFIMVIVLGPIMKCDNQWIVRFIPKVSFDNGTNSDYIEDEFNSAQELLWSLDHTESDIYKCLFTLLSRQYGELKNNFLRGGYESQSNKKDSKKKR